ncbi:hypothetical protein RSOLAG1IB_01866 [Rhizoctonia solani AG-1 IB]|uniref:Transmembrane protein n=1 Tax=Thanatephorus cucumeris (strain AG1-IB / isolate 7/3/14) TaxID=1108050 RepID=A0A0B7FG08_THACB|nr:hypothetical protein RSOLAG1IB_01866 [Rhizoctonia solani AG-1 IB]
MPWARLCFLLALLDCWLYLIITGVLLQGAPRQHRPHLCSLGILLCLLLYSAEKTLIYLCLTEKVRAVWSASHRRLRSPIYLFCVSLLLPLFGMVGGMIIPKAIHYVHNGYCVLGIDRLSSVFLLTYDISINLFLTGMFVIPLARATIRSAWLKTVAIRSTVASLISFVTTATNGVIVYILHGNETIWVCFGTCAIDLTINAAVLYWALQGPGESSDHHDGSVYFSSIGDIFRSGTVHTVAMNQDPPRTSHDSSHRDDISESTVAALPICVSPTQKPEPIVQKT